MMKVYNQNISKFYDIELKSPWSGNDYFFKENRFSSVNKKYDNSVIQATKNEHCVTFCENLSWLLAATI